MKKRIWSKAVSIFTAILLVVGIVPNMTVAVMAAEEIKLFIGGQQITEAAAMKTKMELGQKLTVQNLPTVSFPMTPTPSP